MRIRGWLFGVFIGAACLGQRAATLPSDAVAIEQGKTALTISVGGKLFTEYRFAAEAGVAADAKWNRPYFYPVCAADGVEVTSDQQREVLKDPKVDHPHQRSIWVGHGDVNGVDHWLDGAGQQRHVKFSEMRADGFTEELAWDGKAGVSDPVLLETRVVKVMAWADGARGLEIDSTFRCGGKEAVRFKCKPLNVSGVEAGLCSVRMAKAILDGADGTKEIVTGAGASGEKAARSGPAAWCDYAGLIGGKKYGVAMVNWAGNPGGDVAWHVRMFGLLADIGPLDWTLEVGKEATFKHLVIVHEGGAKEAGVAAKAVGWRGELGK